MNGTSEEKTIEEGAAKTTSTEATQSRESCVKYIDALWFCYSPVYQLQKYYRYGTADDCLGHWSELYSCLKQRTKFAAEEQEQPKQQSHPYWRLRTKEEAKNFWERAFDSSPTSSTGDDRESLGDDFGKKAGKDTPVV